MKKRMLLATLAGAAIALAAAGPVLAQAGYPDRTVTIVVGFPPGGSTDVIARLLAEDMGRKLGQTVVVENLPGATGGIGSSNVAAAKPDGYRLLMTAAGPHGTMPALADGLTYDPIGDFTPIVSVAEIPNVIDVAPHLKAESLADLIALAKADPGALNYGSTSLGSSSHMGGELLKKMAGIDFAIIPFQGGGPLMTALLGDQIDFGMDNLPSSLPHIQAGKLRALAVTTRERFPGAPDIPTVAESGLQGYEVSGWSGLLGPAGMDPAVVETLNGAVNEILADDDFRARLMKIGAVPTGGSAQAFATFISDEISKWSDVVAANGLQKLER